jgi:hypothetical protein
MVFVIIQFVILQSEIHAFDEITKLAIALEASKVDICELSKKSTPLNSANKEVSKVQVWKYQMW